MKREYPEQPIFCVGGIIFQNESVLLIKRNQEPGKGEWSLPGGGVELGETMSDALRREVFEEAAVRIIVGGLVKLIDRIMYDVNKRVRYHYIIADYWGRMVEGIPTAGSDANEVCLLQLDKLHTITVHEEVERVINEAYALKLQQR